MPDPFIAVQDVIDYIGRGGTADPGFIIATDSACEAVRAIMDQQVNFVSGDHLTLDGTGTDALVLPEMPVSGAGTVTVDGGTVTDYVLDQRNGTLIRKSSTTPVTPVCWPWGRQNVVVTYDHGWADQEIPRDIRMVALALAARLVVQGPVIQEMIGQQQIRYGVNSTDFTDGELRILHKHRR